MPPGDRIVRQHKILGSDAENAGIADAAIACQLRCEFVRRSGIRFIGVRR